MNRREILLASAALTLVGTGAHAAEAPYSWAAIPFGGGGFIDGFLYHPKAPDILYARTDIGGMYRYDFAAKRWIALLDHLSHDEADLMGVLSMAVDPNDANRVYAACGLYLGEWAGKGAILRSSDQGKTWQKTPLDIQVGGNADGRGSGDRLIVDPKDGNVLWYGSNQEGLWKSTNAGASFSKVNGPATRFSLMLIDPASGAIYAGGADSKAGLFVSADTGASWQPVDGTPAQVPQHAVFAADGSLYVTFAQGDGKNVVNPSNATSGGVWKRDPSGKWRDVSPIKPAGGASFGFSGVDVGPDGTVAVSTLNRWWPGDDVFVSKDGGGKWIALGEMSKHDASSYPWLASYLKGEDRMGHWISDLKINPFNCDEMIYGTGYGLWMSENLSKAGTGETVRFAFNIKDLEETATIQMTSPTGGAIVLAAFGDVGGAAWDDLTVTPSVGLFAPASESNWSVDYGGQAPDFVARTTNSGNHGMYSENAGANWTAFPASPYRRPGDGQPWKNSGIINVSAKATSLLWVPEKEGAYYSTDKGRTWKESAGWPTGRDQALTPISDKVVDGVYYVHDRSSGNILISVDHGASFKPIVSGLPKVEGWQGAQLAVMPTRMRDLWLVAPFGLLHSRDADSGMVQVKDVDVAWCVGFGAPKVKDGYPAVYLSGKVKGREGLWRSDDEGKSWVRINDDAHQFGSFRAIAGDPLEWGTLYIAPHGRGLLVGKPG
ncbi:BNR/Asp-box repeat family protein [Asticcacaulis biprosthecium C19]|uniref:BNR/Asp-box repeat family protein n=1 Tax=Asticcacaulis biprosthecium C19 TaxID=715226 RepID=F4QTQ7_9CAUL|nr:sialidase family protein [Asticcacaulis biprosthecium]EGF89207.1 BNR/Asp-box repeat family protein [Asticcacaulis biprosthecium C19]